ncbi:MAG TPA: hypothetical protein VKC35_02030 [Vicinamibacterales bacterium]|nr:hypothetical protein [Vicinamibacterales bacterium]
MFSFSPIGVVHTPFTDTAAIPKGCGAKHEAEGTLEILPVFEPGLADIVKPYLSSIPEAALRRGWLEEAERRRK